MKKLYSAVLAVPALVVGTAHAALPTEVTDAVTTLQTDALALINTYVLPAVAAITVAWIILKLLRKGANKVA